MSSDYQIDIDAQALDNAQLELQTLAEEEEKNMLDLAYSVSESTWIKLRHRRLQNWGPLPDMPDVKLDRVKSPKMKSK